MWGIFAVNDTLHPDVYTHRAHYEVFKQLYHFVKPGFKRIYISTKLSKITLSAFYDPATGSVVITGKNDSNQAQSIEGILQNLPAVSSLNYYYTDAKNNFKKDADVKVVNNKFSKQVPASCVFTLTNR